jgi:hypothetical protein
MTEVIIGILTVIAIGIFAWTQLKKENEKNKG